MEQLRAFFEELVMLAGAVLRPAAKSVRENSGLAALSVVLAFGLWIFVTDVENPEQTRRLEVDIPVSPVNVPSDTVVVGEIQPVRVEVRVEENVLESLTKDDFQATVDLEGLTVGDYDNLPVEVRPLTTRGNLRVINVFPSEVAVRVAQLLSKTVPVEVDVRGSPPAGYTLRGTEIPDETNTAVVAGPQEGVAAVTKVVAPVDIDGRTESFESAVRLEARNEQGILVENTTVDPRFVDVSIEIEQVTFGRPLAVSPRLQGTPRQGYNVVGISVDPLVVTVFGSQSYINEATTIPTQPVDIEDATSDVVRTVSLALPTGTTVQGGVSVTVTVRVSAAPGQLTFEVPLRANNLAGNLTIAGALPSVRVFLSGPLPDLLELNVNDISATVNLDGRDAGTHTVRVEVSAPDGLEVRSVSPEDVEILIESR
jgi:YbbR domain-containing protein